MVRKTTWEEFRKTGLLWFVNSVLHLFGYAIVLEVENKKIVNVYPARVKFRGYAEKNNTDGYRQITKCLKENIDTLMEEVQE